MAWRMAWRGWATWSGGEKRESEREMERQRDRETERDREIDRNLARSTIAFFGRLFIFDFFVELVTVFAKRIRIKHVEFVYN